MKFGRGTFNMQRQRNKKQDAKIISQFFKSNTSQFYSTGIMLLYLEDNVALFCIIWKI